MKNKGIIILGLLTLLFITSCTKWYRPSRMFKAKKDYSYNQKPDTAGELEFRLMPNDIMDFRLFTNDGFKLIDLSTMNDENQRMTQQQTNFYYLIEHDGFVKLPMIGRVKLSGMTIKETENFLEEKYSKFYIDPFARVIIDNRRVTVFNGEFSQGTVVEMKNRNLRLIEALALAGGLPREGKAHEIKLFRGDPQNPEIYHFDLSKIDQYSSSNFILQSNDVIYVEPRISLTSEFLREIAPILTMVTSVLTLYILVVSLN